MWCQQARLSFLGMRRSHVWKWSHKQNPNHIHTKKKIYFYATKWFMYKNKVIMNLTEYTFSGCKYSWSWNVWRNWHSNHTSNCTSSSNSVTRIWKQKFLPTWHHLALLFNGRNQIAMVLQSPAITLNMDTEKLWLLVE